MSFQAVIMAGGKGTRLRPFTHVLPKPLLPISERPILDVVLSCLRRDGCEQATVTVGHLGHMIELYCGDGQRWGMGIKYYREVEPLGTVGALAHLEDLPSSPFIVMNGDVLCDVRFPTLIDAHQRAGAALTICAFKRRVRDELGILDADSHGRLTGYREKPEHEYLVSTGIYVLSAAAVEAIPAGQAMDFPDLVHALLSAGQVVHTHVHDGYWLDLGRPDDFAQANEGFESLRPRLGL